MAFTKAATSGIWHPTLLHGCDGHQSALLNPGLVYLAIISVAFAAMKVQGVPQLDIDAMAAAPPNAKK